MATYTPNYNLKKPAQTDFYDVDDFNGNADIIDTVLNNLATGVWNLRHGTTAPANSLGVIGDWYLNTDTGQFYEKTGATTWTARGNPIPGSASAATATANGENTGIVTLAADNAADTARDIAATPAGVVAKINAKTPRYDAAQTTALTDAQKLQFRNNSGTYTVVIVASEGDLPTAASWPANTLYATVEATV